MCGRFLSSTLQDDWCITPVLLGGANTGKSTLQNLLKRMSADKVLTVTPDTIPAAARKWTAASITHTNPIVHLLSDSRSRGFLSANFLSTSGCNRLLLVFPVVHRPETLDVHLELRLQAEMSALRTEFEHCYASALQLVHEEFWTHQRGLGAQLEIENALALVL
jgi:hypothetical protein